MGYGWWVDDENVNQGCGSIPAHPTNSNNAAEHIAAGKLLEFIKNNMNPCNVTLHGDSKLVVNQLNNKWKIKKGNYTKYAAQNVLTIYQMKNMGYTVNFKWIPRELNSRADKLSKICN